MSLIVLAAAGLAVLAGLAAGSRAAAGWQRRNWHRTIKTGKE
jgi:hypothetical protein